MKNILLLFVFFLLTGANFNGFSQTFNPTTAAEDFNVFVKTNSTFQAGQTDAAVAMGGNLVLQGQVTVAQSSTGGYPNALNDANNYGLVVGGKMVYTSGSNSYLNNGYLRLGSATGSSLLYKDCNNNNTNLRVSPYSADCNTAFNATPRLELQRLQTSPTATDAAGLNFTTAFSTFASKSAVMARYTPGSYLASYLNFPVIYTTAGSTNPRITLASGKVNVLNLTGAELNNLSSLTFDNSPNASTPLIFNINQAADFTWNNGNFGGLDGSNGAYMLFNFYNNTGTISLAGSNPQFGTVFAPAAAFQKNNNNILFGQVVANSFVLNGGLVSYNPFNYMLPDDTKDPITAIYHTKLSGVFSSASTWLYNPYGNTFIDALNPPASTNIAYVMAGHLLTLDVNYTVGATGSFTINPTGSMVIKPNVVFTVDGVADFNNQSVTFKSDVNGTGILGKVTGTLLDATNIVAEHYIKARRSFRFLTPGLNAPGSIRANWQDGGSTSAIYGTGITGTGASANGFDWTQTNNPSLFTLNNSTQGWSAVTTTLTNGTLTVGSAYRLMIRGNRLTNMNTNTPTPTPTTLRVSGALFTGNYTPVLNSGVGKYSFVGNPYLSPVDWNALYNASTGISPSYCVWDPTVAGVNGRGAYVTYNSVSRTNNNPSTSSLDGNIQSGQAILITNVLATPSVTFKEAYKTTVNRNVFRTQSAPVSKLSVQLLFPSQLGSSESTDGLVAVFSDDFSTEIHEEDSYKFSNLDENIAINRNGQLLSIEGRPTIKGNDTLPLKVWQLADSNYVLKIEGTDFDPLTTAIVRDNYLHIDYPVNIAASTLVPFNTGDSASKAADRFTIIFSQVGALPVSITSVKGYQKLKGIQVEWNTLSENNMDRYEVEKSTTGQQFTKAGTVTATGNSNSAVSYSWFDTDPTTGNNFYRIKAIEKTGAVKYTEVIKVTVNNKANGISFYPNPVKGNTVNIDLANMAKGTYTINIVNNLGQQVATKNIEHNGGSATQAIVLDQRMVTGSYTIQVLRGDVKISQPIIFQ